MRPGDSNRLALPGESSYHHAGPLVIETELEQDEVQPATELGSDLGHSGQFDEPESLEEPNRRLVLSIVSGNHRVLAAFPPTAS